MPDDTKAAPETKPTPSMRELLESAFDWNRALLSETLGKLGELKDAYEHIALLVLARQEKSPPKMFCWVWENRKHGYNGGAIPNSVVDQCRKIIPNGKWLFRDDGNIVRKHGVEVREPVMCCSQKCADMYNRYRNDQKAKRLGANNSVATGIELR